MDATAIDEVIEHEKFECSLLFSTMALDVGISLKDSSLTTIIIDVADPVSIAQCLGRKRFLDDDDTLTLYIRGKSKQQIGGILRHCEENAEKVRFFQTDGAVAYNARHGRGNDPSGLIVDVPVETDAGPKFEKKTNTLKYSNILYQIEMYKDILKLKDGFCEYIANLLSIEKYTILERDRERQSLAAYLDSFVGKPMLTRNDRQPFIERLNIRQDGKLCKTLSGIAGWIEGSGLPYLLVEHQTSRSVGDGKKKNYRAWEVIRLTAEIHDYPQN